MAAPTRRFLLATGAIGAGALALGGVGLALRPGASHPVPARLAFDETAFRTLQAFAARVCPGTQSSAGPIDALELASLVDAHVATLHPTDQRELNQALWLLENALAGLVLGGRTTPFTTSPREAQDRTLIAWRTSSLEVLRKSYRALRSLCASAYFGDRRVWAASGYPGPPDFGQASAPALQPVQPRTEPT